MNQDKIIYNQEYYRKKKKRLMLERKKRQADSVKCHDAYDSSFYSAECFKRFCQARRDVKCWREDQLTSCRNCGLQDRIDSGFIPKNIVVMKISLMAKMN